MKLNIDNIKSATGEINIDLVEGNIWRIEWISGSARTLNERQARFLSMLIENCHEVIIDIEESMSESPNTLIPMLEYSGKGKIYRLLTNKIGPKMIHWLATQQWLLLGWSQCAPSGPQKLDWSIRDFFESSNKFVEFREKTRASVSVIPFFDNDVWLVGTNSTKID